MRRKLEREFEKRRKRMNDRFDESPSILANRDEYPHHYSSSYERYRANEDEQLPRKSSFIARLFLSFFLFLVVGALFQANAPQFESSREFVRSTFTQSFQFAAVANWYEAHFGHPLVLFPAKEQSEQVEMVYARPVHGVIYEEFAENGRGILVETAIGTKVKAIRGGYVISINEEDEGGQSIVIQHTDGTESIYGRMETLDVNLYDHVKSGHPVGTVTEQDGKGVFYLSLKENNRYIDPSEVLSFE